MSTRRANSLGSQARKAFCSWMRVGIWASEAASTGPETYPPVAHHHIGLEPADYPAGAQHRSKRLISSDDITRRKTALEKTSTSNLVTQPGGTTLLSSPRRVPTNNILALGSLR